MYYQDVHFFAPFPVPAGSTQSPYAYVIGLATSRGKVFSGFESPVQSYAIVTNAPGLNIDKSNNTTIVHGDPNCTDGMDVLENVDLATDGRDEGLGRRPGDRDGDLHRPARHG
jgi:hypothetical protein